MTKDEIRLSMRKKRRELEKEEKDFADSLICEKLEKIISSRDGVIAIYLSSEQEINIDSFIASAILSGRTIVAPRWNGATYELAMLNGLTESDLRLGPMKIREPAEARIVESKDVSIWIVPGLAFSEDGSRLGYGGGWYDRFLSSSSRDALKIGVAYSFQKVNALPCEKHDIKMSRVITEKN